MLELYHSGLSTCSKQVRLALVEKGVPYVSRYVELQHHAHLSAAYLKLNPWGVVPTLVHDGAVIRESSLICSYIDTLKPDKFRSLTKRDSFDRVLRGIAHVKTVGLTGLKIDTVTIKGFNDDELVELIERTGSAGKLG